MALGSVERQGPLRWEAYGRMRGAFARGLAFERLMVSELRADAALPRAQRRWLQAFNQPRVEMHVGLSKLRPTLKRRVQVQHVRLVYEGGALMPRKPESLTKAVDAVREKVTGVEVLVQ